MPPEPITGFHCLGPAPHRLYILWPYTPTLSPELPLFSPVQVLLLCMLSPTVLLREVNTSLWQVVGIVGSRYPRFSLGVVNVAEVYFG